MAWTTPGYSASEVDRAGAILTSSNIDTSDSGVEGALNVLNNFRSSHSFPLHIIKMLLKQRSEKEDRRVIVSQRLKRLPSIYAKLAREENMRLSQMQDVGGCRAILADIGAVQRLVDRFELARRKNPKGRHIFSKPKNYINEPKIDGYRSVHYVVRYQSENDRNTIYNGSRVEIQIRTRLQHAWATAVETVDILAGRSLKFDIRSNLESPNWKRFFALMGSAIALREGMPLVPNTPTDSEGLATELRGLCNSLQVEPFLRGFETAMQTITGKNASDAVEYILVLNTETRRVSILPFRKHEQESADVRYLELEKEHQSNRRVQVVRVSVKDIKSLRAAYPNYYLDTHEFLNAVATAIK